MTRTKREKPFGLHLTVDGYGCNYARLQDQARIWHLLDELPERMGMTKIIPPYVFPYRGKVPNDWGISGFVLIAESHISIHTFPERRFFYFDAFSCKSFNTKEVLLALREEFDMQDWETNTLDRGSAFGRPVPVFITDKTYLGKMGGG